jgi:hypothetical protein
MMGLAAGLGIRFLPATKAHLKEMFLKMSREDCGLGEDGWLKVNIWSG